MHEVLEKRIHRHNSSHPEKSTSEDGFESVLHLHGGLTPEESSPADSRAELPHPTHCRRLRQGKPVSLLNCTEPESSSSSILAMLQRSHQYLILTGKVGLTSL